jgi:cell wall-associated NlpC family hydrolase
LSLGSKAVLRGAAAALVLIAGAGSAPPADAARGRIYPRGHRHRYGVRRWTTGKRFVRVAPPQPAQRRIPGTVIKTAAYRPGLVREALQHRGTPYVWGGASRGGFDCSGFTRYLFLKQRGIQLPHSASAQARMGFPVPNGRLRGGDLLFFSTYRRGISHVGMYLGNGRFIHAANSRKDVRIDSLTGYYARRLKGARRLVR